MYVKGAPENQWDWLFKGVSDDAARERLIVGFEPAGDILTAQLRVRFDIVLS
jgi:protocatechuate 3,4-dioxygenase beta subunit